MTRNKELHMSSSLLQVRKPWVAAALSTLCCGLGQVYCGRLSRGLVMYAVSMLFGPAILLIMLGSSALWLIVFLATVVAATLVYVASIVDAPRIAARMAGQPSESRRGHRPVLLWGMALTSIPCTLGFGFSLRSNVVEAFYIPTSSMEPTLLKGDRFLANKRNIGSRSLERGDLVIFRAPTNPEQRWIKRIVGLPGDTVEMRRGELFINGQVLKREPVPGANESFSDPKPRAVYEHNGERRYQVLVGESDENADLPLQTVPDDSYFVLGDHRGLSLDSRKIGAVSRKEMVGVATWVYSPAGSWERFGAVH
jgi:signal peptidase I